MRINEIELSNFKQHKAKSFQLTGNLIGIVGPNGTGKSNFIKGIQFGLTGDVPDVTKDKLLSWGEKSGFVKLLIDNDVIIKRSVSSNGAEITAKGRKMTGIVNVNNAIKDWYHIDKDLAKQAIFVRQAEIDAILFDTPAKREQNFQRLCGMGSAAAINKKIGEIVYSKFKQPPNYDEQIAALKTKLDVDSARLCQLQKEQKHNKVSISDEELTQLKLSVQEFTQAQNEVAWLRTLAGQINTCLDNITQSEQKLAQLKAESPPITDTKTLQDNIIAARALADQAKKYEAAKADLTNKKAAADAVGSEPVTQEQIAELETKYAKLMEAYHSVQANFNFYTELHDTIHKAGDLPACPVCGSRVDSLVILDKLKAEIDKYGKEKAAYVGNSSPTSIKATIDDSRRKLTSYNITKQRVVAALQQAEQTFSGIEPVEIDMAKLQDSIKEMDAFYSTIEQFSIAVSHLETKLQLLNDEYVKLSTDYSDRNVKLHAKLKILNIEVINETSIDDISALIVTNRTSASTLIDETIAKANENSRRAGAISELAKTVKTLESNIEELNKKREALKYFDTTIQTLNNVKDWFHYSNGPRTLSSGIIADMLANINDFLSTLGAPFFVSPQTQEGLSFECVFQDGRTIDPSSPPQAEDLSGGEKILLATSFRLASYCMFANQLGLLSLDEPTVYLDDKNVSRFCSFLEKVKEVARTLDLQIFIATHERSVIPYMDTVIDLQ